jgi:hypothetical protein
VLKDEVLSASNSYAGARATTGTSATSDAPRYSDAAGVENHPQITDFVPRRYATIAMLVAIGAVTTAALSAMHHFAAPIAEATGMRSAAALELSASDGLGAWLAAIVWIAASAVSLITYSIRRHRIDDYRGRYRVWFMAALVCIAASANSVAGMHQIAADVLGNLTGWTALRDGAVWWLILAGVPIGWIALRALMDMRECRVAAVLLVSAIACYAMSAVAYLGLARMGDLQMQTIAAGAALFMGHWLALASVVSYARFVVLDAQGLIVVRHRAAAKRAAKTESSKSAAAPAAIAAMKPVAPISSAPAISRATLQTAKFPADSSQWVDGSRPERSRFDHDDEEDDSSDDERKLSKADRKRLRKLKAQGRAA